MVKFICLSVTKFDPNYLKTGGIKWYEIFFEISLPKSHVSKILRHPVTILVTVLTKSDLFSTLREPAVNRKYLRALTLVGPTRNNLVLDLLAVLHLDNQLFICVLNAIELENHKIFQ